MLVSRTGSLYRTAVPWFPQLFLRLGKIPTQMYTMKTGSQAGLSWATLRREKVVWLPASFPNLLDYSQECFTNDSLASLTLSLAVPNRGEN